jgi:hypothetical protein
MRIKTTFFVLIIVALLTFQYTPRQEAAVPAHIMAPGDTNYYTCLSGNGFANDVTHWSLGTLPDGDDIVFGSNAQGMYWNINATVNSFTVESNYSGSAPMHVLTTWPGNVLNIGTGGMTLKKKAYVNYYPLDSSGDYTMWIAGPTYISEDAKLNFHGVVGEPIFYFGDSVFINSTLGKEDFSANNMRFFFNSTYIQNGGSLAISQCVYSIFRNDVTISNSTVSIDQFNSFGNVTFRDSNLHLLVADWAEHHDFRNNFAMVFDGVGGLNLTNCTLITDDSYILMNGTETLHWDSPQPIQRLTINNASHTIINSNVWINFLDVRGCLDTNGYYVNATRFDSSNGSFDAGDTTIIMNGTGTLKTDGTLAGGLNNLTIGSSSVITLLSDVYTGNFTNLGGILNANGFHLFLKDGTLLFGDPVPVPTPVGPWGTIGMLLSVIVIACLILFIFKRRRKKTANPPSAQP